MTLFHFEDEPRPGAREVISTLREKAKLRIMMLTGDHESSALRVAKAVCIDEVHCCLKPEDKLNKVKAVSRRGSSYLLFYFIVNRSSVSHYYQISVLRLYRILLVFSYVI